MLKDKPTVDGRPGQSLPPFDLGKLRYQLKDQYGGNAISHKSVLSSALYPQVFKDYMEWRQKFGSVVSKLPTRAFLTPLKEDEELELQISKGVVATIKYKATGKD